MCCAAFDDEYGDVYGDHGCYMMMRPAWCVTRSSLCVFSQRVFPRTAQSVHTAPSRASRRYEDVGSAGRCRKAALGRLRPPLADAGSSHVHAHHVAAERQAGDALGVAPRRAVWDRRQARCDEGGEARFTRQHGGGAQGSEGCKGVKYNRKDWCRGCGVFERVVEVLLWSDDVQ